MSGYCDLKTGLCSDSEPVDSTETVSTQMIKTTILYVTDPICSHCWAMEPAWRKLLYHYGDHVSVRHVYGGLLPGWKGFADAANGIRKPADVAPHWEEVARHYGQPIHPSVWLTDPVESSYPASMAAHTVRLLDPAREEAFLRQVREAVFLEGRNVARPDVLTDCAERAGLDRELFARLQAAGAGKPGFERDLAEVRQLPVRGFPTLIISGPDGKGRVLGGTQPYDRLEETLLQVSGLSRSSKQPDRAEALAAYRSGTAREFAVLLGETPETAAHLLQGEGAQLTGSIWSKT